MATSLNSDKNRLGASARLRGSQRVLPQLEEGDSYGQFSEIQRRRKELVRVRTRAPLVRPLGSRRMERRAIDPRLSLGVFVVLAAIALVAFSTSTSSRPAPQISRPTASAERALLLPTLKPVESSTVAYSVKRGDTLEGILSALGLDGTRASALNAALQTGAKQADVGALLTPGRELSLQISPKGELEELRLHITEGLLAVRPQGEQFVASLVSDRALRPNAVYTGAITRSFSVDAQRVGLPYDLVDDLVDLFSDRIEFRRDFQPGDRFTVILGGRANSGGYSAAPTSLVAAAFDLQGKRHVAVRYVGSDGRARFFDEEGKLIGNTFLRYPVKFSRISSLFSDSRLHPVLKRKRPHNGVDFAAPNGTPVRASGSGRVIFAGYKGPGGYTVQIRHNERYTTAYLHLSKIAKGISKGKLISKGEILGGVGCTGLCTGPHLHYSLYDRGKYTDPLKTKLPTEELLKAGQMIERSYLNRVLFTFQHYQGSELTKLAANR